MKSFSEVITEMGFCIVIDNTFTLVLNNNNLKRNILNLNYKPRSVLEFVLIIERNIVVAYNYLYQQIQKFF